VSDLTRAAVGLFAVIAAPGALAAFASLSEIALGPRLRLVAAATLAAFAGLALIAAVDGPLLDWLDISPESFQVAAGVVMLPLAGRLLWTGETWAPRAASPAVKAWSLLSGPVPTVLILSYSARFGLATALGAAAIALGASAALLMVSGWLSARLGAGLGLLGRFNGALIAVMAIELMVDGVQSV
jgi:small neutral amino acid transporter SnatA (MarC family)